LGWLHAECVVQITDQPFARPSAPPAADARKKYVVLSIAVPSSTSDTASSIELVKGIFQLIDALAGAGSFKQPLLAGLRPETKTKLRKRRDELDANLRADAEREAKEAEQEARDNALAAKRKAEKERIAGLSAAEQQKVSASSAPKPSRCPDGSARPSNASARRR
jgi:hypothetical protein